MDLSTYKFLHIIGIFLLFLAFGGLLLGARTAGGREFAHRRLYVILHGLGLLVLLVSGFGQMARLGIHGMPSWIVAKLCIWLFLGLVLSMIFRKPKLANLSLALIVLAGALAAWLVIFKPF